MALELSTHLSVPLTGKSCRSCLLKLRLHPHRHCDLQTIGFLGCFIQSSLSQNFCGRESGSLLRQPQRDAFSHVRAFRLLIYQSYLVWPSWSPTFISPHVGVVVVVFNFILWFLWLLCLMELDHIINVTENGSNAVFILHIQLEI